MHMHALFMYIKLIHTYIHTYIQLHTYIHTHIHTYISAPWLRSLGRDSKHRRRTRLQRSRGVAMLRGQMCPPNANRKGHKKNIKNCKTHTNTSNLQNAVPATVFEDIIVESTQETPSKLDFHPAFAPAMTRPRVCCKHFTTNKNSKFLGF